MPEKLVVDKIEVVTYIKNDEPKELFKAILVGGENGTKQFRKAVFFSKTLKEHLDARVGKELEFEFEEPRREGGDPGIAKVLDGTEQLFPKKGGSGSRPLLTDEQTKWIAAGLHDIADALRTRLAAVGDLAVTGSAEAFSEPVQPPSSQPAKAPNVSEASRQKWMNELHETAMQAFDGSQRLYEGWLRSYLQTLKVDSVDRLDVQQLMTLVQDVRDIGEVRRRQKGAA